MLVKNILIEDNKEKIRIEVSDANMRVKSIELKISKIIDEIIEESITDDTFVKLINKEKNNGI